MSVRIYRVQDVEGRGPYKPGLSDRWTDAHHEDRNPSIFEDFNISPSELKKLWREGENGGCAFRTQQSLQSWFGMVERLRLEELGYFVVTMLVDRIILESDRQLIFARIRPLRLGVIKLPWACRGVGRMNITCEHCDSEIDVEKDPRCVVYDPSGATDVICKKCRELAIDRWLLDGEWSSSLSKLHRQDYRIKRGWRA